MADVNDKVLENVPGTFYVDSTCIQCGNCCEVAPHNFTQNNDTSYVFKQPEDNDDDECMCALEECPVDAIGDDGIS